MNIPKTMSAPLDPAAPSFLNLPAEVRNIITEILFKRPDPILIHNADYYYNRRPHNPGPHSVTLDTENETDDDGEARKHAPEWYGMNVETWEKRLENGKNEAQIFVHHSSLGLGLLKSCRQLYHETVCVLYFQNTFIFSRVPTRHDKESFQRCSNEYGYHQLKDAPLWLRSLGSQFGLIKKVVIDVSAECGIQYVTNFLTYYLDPVDFLPLLRIMWEHPLAPCKIAFGHTGRKLHSSLDPEPVKSDEKIRKYADMLNRFFVALARDDALGLRRFSRSGALLASIEILRNNKGRLVFHSRSPSTSRKFLLSKGGRTIKWEPTAPVKSFFQLDGEVRDTIFSLVATSLGGIQLDMDNRLSHGLNRNIFNVSAQWRDDLIKVVGRQTPVSIEFSTTKPITDFGGFASLEEFSLLKSVPPDYNQRLITLIVKARFQNSYTTSVTTWAGSHDILL